MDGVGSGHSPQIVASYDRQGIPYVYSYTCMLTGIIIIIIIIIVIFLFPDDIKIFHTVNLQLNVRLHNPNWIPFAVSVLLT